MRHQHLFNKVSCEALDLIMMVTKVLGQTADSKFLREDGVEMCWAVETAEEYHDNDKIGDSFPAVRVEQCEHGHTNLRIVTDFVENGSDTHKNLLLLGGWALETLPTEFVSVHYGFEYTGEDDDTDTALESPVEPVHVH